MNQDLCNWYGAEGMQLQLTAPYSPPQNGVAKHMNHMLVELVRAMLALAQLPEFLWEQAVEHTVYVYNMAYSSSPRLVKTTLYQVWYGQKLNIAHLQEFRAPVWILKQGQNITYKMLPKSEWKAYVGNDDRSKAIKYYNTATRNILTLCNFHFLTPTIPLPPEEIVVEDNLEGHSDKGENAPSYEGEEEGEGMRSSIPEIESESSRKRKRGVEEEPDIDDIGPQKMRGKKVNYKYLSDPFPDDEEAGIVSVMKPQAYAVIPEDEDCKTLSDAKKSIEWPQWQKAIEDELEQLKCMGTWKLVEKPPKVILIVNKFVLAKKQSKEGCLLRYNVRLVTKGCAQ